MGLFGRPRVIKDYQRLRAAGRELVKKVNLEVIPIEDFNIFKAAKKLTMPLQGRTIIFEEEETEMAALMDFFLHEFRAGGRRPIDCCDPDLMELSPDERALLAAHQSARTSLYEVTGADKRTARLALKDLLEPDRPDVLLSDLSLSSCDVAGKILMFIRVVECQGIQMTSGSFFTFSVGLRESLLQTYHARMKTVPASEKAQRAFIFFFQHHRAHGRSQAFAEPEP